MLQTNRSLRYKIGARRALLAGLSLLLLVALPACGRKGPPVPPGTVEPAAVKDLRHEIDGNTLTLRWKVPRPSSERGAQPVARARIYRSKQAAAEGACDGCPLMFSLVKEIPHASVDMSYAETLETGFRYAFKVVLVDSGGAEGADSNVVRFTFE